MPIDVRKAFHRKMDRSYFSEVLDTTAADWAVFAAEMRSMNVFLSVGLRLMESE